MTENEIGKIVVDSALKVHRTLGPGLLESVYETTLAYELSKRGLSVQRQVPIAINNDQLKFDNAFKADLIINSKVILELKSKEYVNAVDKKQLQTYLKLSDMKLGFLINFGELLIKNGINRAVNGLDE